MCLSTSLLSRWEKYRLSFDSTLFSSCEYAVKRKGKDKDFLSIWETPGILNDGGSSIPFSASLSQLLCKWLRSSAIQKILPHLCVKSSSSRDGQQLAHGFLLRHWSSSPWNKMFVSCVFLTWSELLGMQTSLVAYRSQSLAPKTT